MTVRPEESSPTEPRRSRRDERASDEFVGAVVRLLPDAAVVVDQEGFIVSANPLAETLFRYPPGGLAGQPLDRLVPERFRRRHVDHRASYVSNPAQRPMGAGLDLWGRRRDGSEFPVDISLAPLGVPERPLTMAAVRDLSQRRADWAALGRLAAIVSSSEDAIVSTDLNGTVTSWNPGALKLLGFTAEQIIGRPMFRLVPTDQRSDVEERLARMRAGTRMPTRDALRVRSDGELVDVSESMSVIREPSGDPIGFTWLMRDISARKRSEHELRQLLLQTQRRERWLEAISEIRLRLTAGGSLTEPLSLISRQVCELSGAESSAILLVSLEPGHLTVEAFEGEVLERLLDRHLEVEGSPLADVMASGRTWRSSETIAGTSPHWPVPWDSSLVGPLVLAPLVTSEGTVGLLAVSRAPGREEFDSEDLSVVESLAQQGALAVKMARAQVDRDQLALIADRERIARDLHDHVIQRLFAVGMSLQAAAHSITDPLALERITESVEELDATIRDVRSTIFSLEFRTTERVQMSTRSRILDIASKAADPLGFQPRLQFDGPVDTRVPEEMVNEVLAVIRECLSNTARHAGASTVSVKVEVHRDLVITVQDDGRGLEGARRSSGLSNLRARAEARGGSMSTGTAEGRGTRIKWWVPLPR